MVQFIKLLNGESVIKIEDYTNKMAWSLDLWNGKVVVFIENENGEDDEMKAALSQGMHMAIKDWVSNNGTIVLCTGNLEPLQVLTGLNLKVQV